MIYALKPILHHAIWGGRRLSHLLTECPEDLAHLYLATGHEDMSNFVLNANIGLRELFKAKKAHWNMSRYSEFPLTIALVDATQNLSIQVHPDADLAGRLEGKAVGKTESWLFLDIPKQGWIYAGCGCDSVEEIKDANDRGDIEKILSHLHVNQGDCVCVRDGTLHALTAGSLVYEIEFGSNYTYRFYDYRRLDKSGNPRRLDVDKALMAIQPYKKPTIRRPDSEDRITEPEYELRILHDARYYRNESTGLECLSVINGSGSLENMTFKEPVGLLLEPGDELKSFDIQFGIVARLGERHEN